MQNKRVWDNGIYRDATQEELEEMERIAAELIENEIATEEDYINALSGFGVEL